MCCNADNDEDETLGASRGAIALEGAKKALEIKMNQLHTSQNMLGKKKNEGTMKGRRMIIITAKLGKELENVMMNGEAMDRKIIGERIHMFTVSYSFPFSLCRLNS